MKNSGINVKEKLIARYLEKDPPSTQSKSSNINVLLNRIAAVSYTHLTLPTTAYV